MKEYPAQTPLPPSIRVLQRLPMNKALLDVEDTPRAAFNLPSFCHHLIKLHPFCHPRAYWPRKEG